MYSLFLVEGKTTIGINSLRLPNDTWHLYGVCLVLRRPLARAGLTVPSPALYKLVRAAVICKQNNALTDLLLSDILFFLDLRTKVISQYCE